MKVKCQFCKNRFDSDKTIYCIIFFRFVGDKTKALSKAYNYVCRECANSAIKAIEESIE